MLKLPPFSKNLCHLIRNGSRPLNDINLFIGDDAWQKGKSFSISYPDRTLILPPWISAHEYFWPVKDCGVIIFDTGYASDGYVEEVVLTLFGHGASIVYFICKDNVLNKESPLFIFKKGISK
jgi:hypothetical protein